MMSRAASLRLAISLAGMALALIAIFSAPFGGWADILIAGGLLLGSSIAAERVFRKAADTADLVADLPDRTDNPPS